MKKINLKELPITNIEGKEEIIDISQDFGNLMFRNAMTVVVHEAAIAIYNTGECNAGVEEKETIKSLANQFFPYCVQQAIEKILQ